MPAPSTTAGLIAQAESGTNPNAVRFEPAHKPTPENIALVQKHNDCNARTAAELAATSFGQFQMMADTLYELGYAGSIPAFWGSVAMQVHWFYELLQRRKINFPLATLLKDKAALTNFARHYNGDPDLYAPYLLDTYKKMSATP